MLIVDKPAGCTSFDVVAEVRRALGVRKAGHTGTLDPLATGVLAVCVGEATKVAGLLTEGEKEYHGTGELGVETDTLDASGTVVARRDWSVVRADDLRLVLVGLTGSQLQVPPAFSAVHVDGKRAYELARAGTEVPLPPRPIHVASFDLLRWDPPRFETLIRCSKGTYVRSLVAEVGRRLGCGATLAALRRVRSGPFHLDQSVALAALPERWPQHLLSIDAALGHLPAQQVTPDEARRLRQGQPVAAAPVAAVEPVRAPSLVRLREAETLVALGEVRGSEVWPKRVFALDA